MSWERLAAIAQQVIAEDVEVAVGGDFCIQRFHGAARRVTRISKRRQAFFSLFFVELEK